MLREAIQICTGLFLLGAAVLTALQPMAWPFLAVAAVFAVGVFYERNFYRGAAAPRGGGWQPTAERFRDEESGEMVTVWFNPATGERRYVEQNASPPA
ncbi:MAG: hypothetical protein QOD42_511 [Sphingomonadales bacterium]|jgi:hypothetical protein|nr:hypothetical protein [Sphingomonadales bacterium]